MSKVILGAKLVGSSIKEDGEPKNQIIGASKVETLEDGDSSRSNKADGDSSRNSREDGASKVEILADGDSNLNSNSNSKVVGATIAKITLGEVVVGDD